MADADAAAREEAGRLLFARECAFVAGAARIDQLPGADAPEVAFAGRSNVGKSSLINALAGRAALARTSNTPGRTRQINFFALAGDRLRLVDPRHTNCHPPSSSTITLDSRVLCINLRPLFHSHTRARNQP